MQRLSICLAGVVSGIENTTTVTATTVLLFILSLPTNTQPVVVCAGCFVVVGVVALFRALFFQ